MRVGLVLGVIVAAPVAAWAQCPVVSTTADAVAPVPPGSLRDCVQRANLRPGFDVITFDPAVFAPGEIRLRAALPAVDDPAGVRLEGGDAARVVIDGRDVPDVTGIDVRSRVEVVGLTLRNFRGGGFGAGTAVFVRNNATVSVERCVITANTGGGVLFQGLGSGHRIADSVISFNDIAGVRWYGPGTPCHSPRSVITRNVFRGNNPGGLSADDIFVSFSGCLDIIDNRFEGNPYFGIRFAGGSRDVRVERNVLEGAGVGVFAGARDNVFLANRFAHDAGRAITIGDGQGSTDNRIIGNVFTTGGAAVGVYLYDRSSTTRLFHNTFLGYRSSAVEVDGVQAVDVRNNLFVDMPAGVVGPLADGSVVDSNGFFQVPVPCGGCDAGAIVEGPPGFVAAPTDLRLDPCSAAAIDRGVDLGSEQPLQGIDGGRFEGQAPDLGAFEALPCASMADAGALDAGVEEAPEPPRAFGVGCGCFGGGAGADVGLGLVVLAGLSARATRRRTRGAVARSPVR